MDIPRILFFVEQHLPKEALTVKNQAYVAVKALHYFQQNEFVTAHDFLQAATAHHSQDTLLQDIQYHVEQQMRSANLREQRNLKNRFCTLPFQRLDFTTGLKAYLCCAGYLPSSIGNLTETESKALWLSPKAQEIRSTILDGSFSFCNKITCPAIGGNTLPLRQKVDVDYWIKNVHKGPRRINLSFDKTCNLSCPSCRDRKIIEPSVNHKYYIQLFQKRIAPLLENCEYIEVCGSGDPLASQSMRYILGFISMNCENISTIHIMTNAQLFSRKWWDKMPGLHGRAQFYVSVDAARASTYSQVRRGGSFSRLLRILKYLGRLREEKAIKSLMLAFVVQHHNYREMPAFVKLAKAVGADKVQFTRMTNWGSMTPQVYSDRSVWNSTNKEYQNFINVIQHPLLKDPIVAQSDLWVYRK